MSWCVVAERIRTCTISSFTLSMTGWNGGSVLCKPCKDKKDRERRLSIGLISARSRQKTLLVNVCKCIHTLYESRYFKKPICERFSSFHCVVNEQVVKNPDLFMPILTWQFYVQFLDIILQKWQRLRQKGCLINHFMLSAGWCSWKCL